MTPIDLDKMFKMEILKRIRAGDDAEKLEDEAPDMLLAFHNTPNDALGGLSPNEFFYSMNGIELVGALSDYVASDIDVPDPLLNALEDAEDAENALFGLLTGAVGGFFRIGQMLTARRYAAELLNQKGSTLPTDAYIGIVLAPAEDAGLTEAAVSGLSLMGESVKEKLLAALRTADDDAADRILDLLSVMAHDERIYDVLIRHFKGRYERRAYCAWLLSRYGDERAVPVLVCALDSAGYADYKALCEAIEALGGPEQPDRAFPGDVDYEKMKGNI